MVFSYYKNLQPLQKQVYHQSDAVSLIRLSHPERLRTHVNDLREALASADGIKTEAKAQALVSALLTMLQVSWVRVRVLEKRPSQRRGELHGLYERRRGQTPLITVWMRTAKRAQVVSFKTFLRTILHEVAHHLDYGLLHLRTSFHTRGFYQRESSLLHQLLEEKGATKFSTQEPL